MEEYAIKRLINCSPKAPKQPQIMEKNADIQMIYDQAKYKSAKV